MDALLGFHSRHWRATDWAAAAVSGLAAGAVLMVLDLIWSMLFNAGGPWRISHMIAPVFLGGDKATDYAFSVGVISVSLAVHYALGIVFGLAMAAVMAQLQLDDTPGGAAVTGAMLGLALYLINFDLLAGLFPWLADLRGGDTLAAHALFGIVAALLYWRLKRTAAEP